jgi:hypothetical protein
VLWLIISAIWWAMAVFAYDELFIPETVKASVYNYLILMMWIGLVLLFFKMRERKISSSSNSDLNSSKVKKGNINTYIIENKNDEEVDAKEVLTSEYQNKNIGNMTSPQLLSYAVNLLSNGHEVRALSMLRKIAGDGNAPIAIRYSAYHHMLKIMNSNKKTH